MRRFLVAFIAAFAVAFSSPLVITYAFGADAPAVKELSPTATGKAALTVQQMQVILRAVSISERDCGARDPDACIIGQSEQSIIDSLNAAANTITPPSASKPAPTPTPKPAT